MNAFTPPQTIRRSIARDLAEVPAPKTYEDYLADGRAWAEDRIAGATWRGAYSIETLAEMFAQVNAPASVRADWSWRMKAARDLQTLADDAAVQAGIGGEA